MERRRVRVSCTHCTVTGCIKIVTIPHLNKKFVQIFGIKLALMLLNSALTCEVL